MWDILAYMWRCGICDIWVYLQSYGRGKPAWDLDITAFGYVGDVRIYVNSISMEHIMVRTKYFARYIADGNINIVVNENTLISTHISL